MKKILLLLFLINLLPVSYSQTEVDTELKDALISQVAEVQTAKYTYSQTLTHIRDYVFNLAVTQTSLKGKSKSNSFEFSLSDMNKHTVTVTTQKDQIMINIKTVAGKKYIKSISEEGSVSYTSGFVIIAENNNNAQEIKESFEKMMPLSKALTEERMQAESYEELLTWLQENIINVTAGNIQIEQNLIQHNEKIGVVGFTQSEITAKKQTNKIFEFNLADLNDKNIIFLVKGSTFSIKLETKSNLLHIRTANEEAQLPYTKSLQVFVDDSERAYDLKAAFEKVIPLAEELVEESLPNTEDLDELLSLFKSHINNVSNPSIIIDQEVNEAILCELKTVTQTPKAVINNTYNLFLGELDNNTVKTKISKTKIVVSAGIKGKKPHIKVQENDDLQNYASSINFYCDDIKTSRHLVHILKQLIPIAKKNYQPLVPEGDTQVKLDWAMAQVTDVKDSKYNYVQSIEPLEDNIIKYRLEKSSTKKTDEIIYEFNLSDINPKLLNLEIKGNKIYVNFITNGKTKVINYYENAEVKPYISGFKIQFSDYEIAHNFVQAMIDVIEGAE